MELWTSVHNKGREQKACEVLGRIRERKERETAELGLVQQPEPKPFLAEPSAPGPGFPHSWGCRGAFLGVFYPSKS